MTTRDTIVLESLQVPCIIGVRPEERTNEQPLAVDVELGIDLREAGRTGRISDTCDYDNIANDVIHLLRFRRYRLLEGAAHELAGMLLGVHQHLERVSLRLRKPLALTGRARAASVAIARTQQDFPRRFESASFGQVEVLLETREAGLYLLHVDPGGCIPAHHHKVMRELEWLIAGELERNGRPLRQRDPAVWRHGVVHDYVNCGDTRASLFCCDEPAFFPEDEIVIESKTVDP